MKENICIIVKSLKGGGAERAAANLSKDLSDKYHVFLVLFDGTDIAYPYKGCVIDLHTKPVDSKIGKIINVIKRFAQIKKIKRTYCIHYSISFMFMANVLNIMTQKTDKTIISVRNTLSMQKNTRMEEKMISWIGKKADKIVSLSDGVKEDLVQHFAYDSDKVITIYNSCDKKWLYQNENNERDIMSHIDLSLPTIATVGRLTYQKGQWHLLRALFIVLRTIPKCNLVIFGTGELKEKLSVYSEKLGISEHVYFQGYVKGYHHYLEECDFFVLASIYEGLGNVLLEALACGMPVISTDCPHGPKEILHPDSKTEIEQVVYGEYGILVPAFSTEEFDESKIDFEESDFLLAEAMINMVKNDELRQHYQKKAIQRSRDFQGDKVRESWITLIDDLKRV